MRLEDNYKEKKTKKQNNASKPINTWRLLNNQLVTEEINEEIKKKNPGDNENTKNPKPMGYIKNNTKGEVYSDTSLPQETRISLINNITLYLKELGKKKNKQNPKLVEGKKS